MTNQDVSSEYDDNKSNLGQPLPSAVVPWEAPEGELNVASTVEDPYVMLAAMQEAIPFDDLIQGDGKLSIQHVIVHQIELVNDETGEVTKAPRTILIDNKGVAYACVSKGVLSSLKAFTAAFGSPPWDPPIKCTVRQVSLKGGFRTYRLIPHK